ncbi:MAG TPA: inositol monophosphatase family protein [bacterium]|nr:inositol monophosphatase family protein [bacterium]
MKSAERIRILLEELGKTISGEIGEQVRNSTIQELSSVAREDEDDTIYEIDRKTEERIMDIFEKKIGPEIPCILIMEGSPSEGLVFGPGGRGDAEYTVIMDPLDGTRGLMYGKRSAWVLSAAAPGGSAGLTLKDIVTAVQTEIPAPKQTLFDQLSATAGSGACGRRFDLSNRNETSFNPSPSSATGLQYGFATFNRFFPGIKTIVNNVENELFNRLGSEGNNYFYFEDQYICNGGQLAELATGRDRFVCDIRAAAAPAMVKRGLTSPLCTHPYDVCTELIAREAGVIVTGPDGGRLDYPLDTLTDVAWIGYANENIRQLIEPHILDIIARIEDCVPDSENPV